MPPRNENVSGIAPSPDLSESIQRIWAGPSLPNEVVADLRRAGGTSLDALVAIAINESVATTTRSSAVWLLGRLKHLGSFKKTKSLKPLVAVLVGRDEYLRCEAAIALGVLADRRAIGHLKRAMLGDLDSFVRALAAQSLGMVGGPKAITALREVFIDPQQDSGVRAAAAEALGASFSFDCAPELISALSDPADEVRFWSAYALGFMRIREALPELERLAADDDAEVPGWWSISKEATWAIAEITEGTPWR